MLVTTCLLSVLVALVPNSQSLAVNISETQVDSPTVQIRIAKATPGEGFVRMHSMVPNQSVFVHRRDIVSDEYIEWIAAKITPHGVSLDVHLSREGAARLAEASTRGFTQGLQLAIIVQGRLAGAMRGAAPLGLTDGRLDIGLSIPPTDAAQVVAAIAARWPEADR